MNNKLWVVFAIRGHTVIEPTVLDHDHERSADRLYATLCNRMNQIAAYDSYEPGWSVHKVLAYSTVDDNLRERIRAEAEAELARIERDGGEAGFALRVLAMAKANNK